MPLASGTRLGAYEVVAPLGAGGMGEVYRARDTKLGRDVALKVLPEAFAASADRVARFRREAQLLATLNHPGIAQIYGVEDSGQTPALVLELVEGPTLADCLKGASLPTTTVVPIARQIAVALEAAHDAGIVHRDLKPANIKLTWRGAALPSMSSADIADATVKILDFGLAKAFGADVTGADADATMTSPAMTAIGMILGTAAYMSPEQAKGRTVDKRADIWAFGVVLFEMLSGTPPFTGESVAETIGFIATRDPEWTRLPADTPPAIRRLLARCLDRDPGRRLRDIGEARIVLTGPIETDDSVSTRPKPSLRWRTAAIATAAVAIAAAVTATAVWRLRPTAELPLRQFELPERFTTSGVISPDGSRFAFLSDGKLGVQAFDARDPSEIASVSVNTTALFWSPDSRTIGFVAGGALKTIAAAGGPIFEVCKLPPSGRAMGVGWRHDGTIVLAGWRDGLYSVPASGGVATRFVPIDPAVELDFHGVSVMPDDRLIVATHLRGDTPAYRVELVDAGLGGKRRPLISDPFIRQPMFSATGHLLLTRFGANEGLWTVPFDGTSVDMAAARLIAPGAGSMSNADDGTLMFSSSASAGTNQELVAVTRSGDVTRVPGAGLRSNDPCCPALSPDGSRVALVATIGDVRNLVVRNLATGVDTRLTFQQSDDDRIGDGGVNPSWLPAGDRVLYTAGSIGNARVVERLADGTGGARVKTAGYMARVSPDGRHLILIVDEAGLYHLRRAPIAPDASVGAAVRILQGGDDPIVREFDLSPDGTLLAFAVRQADNQLNVFLTRFPSGQGRWQVSTEGGMIPRFSRDGRELFFTSGARDAQGRPAGRLNAVRITTAPAVTVSPIVTLLQNAPGPTDELTFGWFDVGADGRFLMFRRVATDAADRRRLVVVQNWPALMRRQ